MNTLTYERLKLVENSQEIDSKPKESPNFIDRFREECITGSGIDPDLYDHAIKHLIDVQQTPGGDAYLPIHDALGWNQEKFVRFGHQVRPTLEAAAFMSEDHRVWQCKLNNPLTDRDGKIRRYESPSREAAEGRRAYFPPVPASIREKISHRWGIPIPSKGSFWKWLADHPLVPICITEGGKKGLKGLTDEMPTIALTGCHGGVIAKDDYGRPTELKLIPELKPFVNPGRLIYLALDKDTSPKAKADVTLGTNRLGGLLEKGGCTLKTLEWEAKDGKGLDDYLVGGGTLDQLLANAQPGNFAGKEYKSKNKRMLRFLEAEYSDRLRQNEMTQQIELDGKPIRLEHFFLDIAEEFDVDISEAKAARLAELIARKNRFSPVRDYLNSLPEGDPNFLNDLAQRYLGNDTPLAAKLLRKTLIAAVARIYEPGCKHDTITILHGKQGTFKSTFWNVLAGDWFTDSLSSSNEKDEKLQLRRYWILEYSEFETAYRRKEVEVLKAFLTCRVDSIRRPYSREVENFPRSSIFVGTTNTDEFLRDPTGERRFWVLPVKRRIPIHEVERERDQIWAAARTAYLAEESWHLPVEKEAELLEQTKQWKEFDPWEEDLARILEFRNKVTMSEIFDGLGIQTSLKDSKSTRRISAILKQMGWQSKRGAKGKRFWFFSEEDSVTSVTQSLEANQRNNFMSDTALQSPESPSTTSVTHSVKTTSDTATPEPPKVTPETPSATPESPHQTQSQQELQAMGDAETKKNDQNTFKKIEKKSEKSPLPEIGTWVMRNDDGEVFKCIAHYPHGQAGFERRSGELLGAMSEEDYEPIDNPNDHITPSDIVRLTPEAIKYLQSKKFKVEPDWLYKPQHLNHKGDRVVQVTRITGPRNGRRKWDFPFSALELVIKEKP